MLWHFQITISHLGWNFRIIITTEYRKYRMVYWPYSYEGIISMSLVRFKEIYAAYFCVDKMWRWRWVRTLLIYYKERFVNKNRHIGLVLSRSVEEEVIMSPMIVILSNPILFVWTRDGRDGRNQMMVNAIIMSTTSVGRYLEFTKVR